MKNQHFNMNYKVEILINNLNNVIRINNKKLYYDCCLIENLILEKCNKSENLIENLYLINKKIYDKKDVHDHCGGHTSAYRRVHMVEWTD